MRGVARTGYDAWRHRPPWARVRADAGLLARIKRVPIRARQTCRARRIPAERQAAGERHGRKRSARLRRAAGVVGASRRRGGPVTTPRDKQARPAPDRVDRDVPAAGPNQLSVADLTDVPTLAGFLYLALGGDVWSRRVVGRARATHRRAALVRDARNLALGQRRPGEVIHHADPGSQDPSLAVAKRGKPAGVPPAIGSVGNACDNPRGESLFAALQCQLLKRRRLTSQVAARIACFSFIKGCYNPTRRHSAPRYRSPLCYKQQRQTERQSAIP